MSAPIRYTCREIDRNLSLLEDIRRDICSILNSTDLDDIHYDADHIIDYLNEINLEGLRESNSDLRSWGEQLEEEVKELQRDIIKLERELERADRELA